MTRISEVLGWPLDELAAAAAAFDLDAEVVVRSADTLTRSLTSAPDWHGTTRDAAGRRARAEAAGMARMELALRGIALRTRVGHGVLVSIRDRLRDRIARAEAEGFAVADNGAVAHPHPSRREDSDFLTERIRELLSSARAADRSLRDQLAEATSLLTGSGDHIPSPTGVVTSPAAAAKAMLSLPPEATAAYWESLTAAQRARLTEVAPGVIGNLDGVPFGDRDRANRVSIARRIGVEKREPGGGDPAVVTRLRELLDPVTDDEGRTVPRRIVTFHADDGRYVEMIGELTPTATGAAVMVPGTGTSLANADASRRRALGLAQSSGAPVFVFVDGELPPDLPAAADADYAERMAPRLVTFMASLDRELDHSAVDLKTTVIGHSYGGSVVGTAEQLGMGADRVVYASSAGTGVLDGPWRNPNPEVSRYSLTPPGDPIHYVQQFAGVVHGGDPDVAPGVTRLDTGYYDGPDHRLVAGRSAHSDYLDDPRSGAMRNIAAVVAGRPTTRYVDRGPDIDTDSDAPYLLSQLRDKVLDLVPFP
ncbi:alpha/beta hydrolase [Gordonia shandongensis]|uniref:alpha/beta hydrolase n=1 Tax=Gordonia shandongensis TaxID=376351 RepID=UPI0004086023|nr:alpha/beta hydrolase [Gordonia shandongensis]